MQLKDKFDQLKITKKLDLGRSAQFGNTVLTRVLGMIGVRITSVPAKTVSIALTANDLLAGMITVQQGAGAASVLTLPTAALLTSALPSLTAGDGFDFSVINTSTVAAESASLATAAGWTLVGAMDMPAYSAAGSFNSSGRFRALYNGSNLWTLYRL